MKLLRFGDKGSEKPGILDAFGNIRDLSAHVTEYNIVTLADSSLWHYISSLDLSTLPLVSEKVRIGAPIGSSGKNIFVGFNSKEHAKELGLEVKNKADPILFMKPNSSIAGPNDPISFSSSMQKLDWEAELALVIGKQGKYIATKDAKNYIFGYTCCNDLSERYLQFETSDKQFTKGKCFDGSAPLGPYLVTKDEITDASKLTIKLWVNSQKRQDFKTSDYINNDENIIAYVSQYFTLYPGDLISMGSAPGCASAWNNSYLQPGDSIELSISSIGTQKQNVVLETKKNVN